MTRQPDGKRPHDPEAANAARQAIDPERLLPGEDPESELIDVAAHWVAVYTELIAGKARVLDVLLQQMDDARQDATRQEFASDQTIMLTEIERFQRRLRFWHDREIALRGGPRRPSA